jgi:hypothetical protein
LALTRFSKAQFGGNITGFCYISRDWPAQALWNEKTFLRDDAGYDGQYYFYVAHDPFIRTNIYSYFWDGWTAYRFQRIAYPLLAYLFSAGQPPLIPYAMLLINIFAALLGTYFVMKIAELYGKSSWNALFYGALTGLFIATTRNLTEPVQMAALCGGLYYYARGSLPIASVFFTAASLSKDTSLLVPAVLFWYEVLKKRNYKTSFYFAVPAVFYFSWMLYIHARLDRWSFATGAYQGGYSMSKTPFVFLYRNLMDKIHAVDFSQRWTHQGMDLYLILCCILAIGFSLRGFLKRGEAFSILLVFFGIFCLFIADPWIDLYSYTRTTAPLFLLLIVHALSTGDRWALIPVAAQAFGLILFLKCAAVF